MSLLYCTLLRIFKSRQLPAKIDTYMYLIISVSCATGLTILLIYIFFFIYDLKKLNADICDEMLELYGGGKKKEKTEASDDGSSSNHSSPMPSSSPPAKKRVRQVYSETRKYLWDVCYCVARKKQIRCERTKKQIALIITLIVTLRYPELYCGLSGHYY